MRPLLSTPALKLAYDRLDSLGADFEVSREATLSTDYPITEKLESFIQSSWVRVLPSPPFFLNFLGTKCLPSDLAFDGFVAVFVDCEL